jgi:hypothetical protein
MNLRIATGIKQNFIRLYNNQFINLINFEYFILD